MYSSAGQKMLRYSLEKTYSEPPCWIDLASLSKKALISAIIGKRLGSATMKASIMSRYEMPEMPCARMSGSWNSLSKCRSAVIQQKIRVRRQSAGGVAEGA